VQHYTIKAFPRHTINLDPSFFLTVFTTILKGQMRSGQKIEKFEQAFAKYIGSPCAIGVGQARLGFILILKMLGLKEGDEVILAAYNFHIIPEAITSLGLKPVFIDVKEDTYTIDISSVKDKLTPRTKAIVVTHMFGQPADMDDIVRFARSANLRIIEDCAHALGTEFHGEKVGSFGDAAIFSFGKGKNMPCFGGGMITCNDKSVSDTLKSYVLASGFPSAWELFKNILKTAITFLATAPAVFTFFTFPILRVLNIFGYDLMDFEEKETLSNMHVANFNKKQLRLANIQATIGLRHLQKLDYLNEKRIENAKLLNRYLQGIKNIYLPRIIPECKATFLYYNIRIKNKNFFRQELFKKGIDTSKKNSMSDCSTLTDFSEYRTECPVSTSLKDAMVEIPCNHILTTGNINYISEAIKKIMELHYNA